LWFVYGLNYTHTEFQEPTMSLCERGKEIKRRRHRKKKLAIYARKLQKATVSERAQIAEKIRALTPGCEVIIESLGLRER
jgi:hypothetical protein